jgi:predicted nucleotidyltransferase
MGGTVHDDDPRAQAGELAGRMHELWGDALRSVLLYGSVVRGEYLPGYSDINLLVLLDDLGTDRLRAGGPLVRAWVDRAGTAPMIMAKRQWRRAGDAFAIELADMLDAHEVMFGVDPLEGATVDRRALRLQAERELRGKLVRLDTAILLNGDDDAELGALLASALPSFATFLRTALRLSGQPVPGQMEGVLEAGATLVGADPEPLVAVAVARSGQEPGARSRQVDVDAYREAVQQTADYIDSLENAT